MLIVIVASSGLLPMVHPILLHDMWRWSNWRFRSYPEISTVRGCEVPGVSGATRQHRGTAESTAESRQPSPHNTADTAATELVVQLIVINVLATKLWSHWWFSSSMFALAIGHVLIVVSFIAVATQLQEKSVFRNREILRRWEGPNILGSFLRGEWSLVGWHLSSYHLHPGSSSVLETKIRASVVYPSETSTSLALSPSLRVPTPYISSHSHKCVALRAAETVAASLCTARPGDPRLCFHVEAISSQPVWSGNIPYGQRHRLVCPSQTGLPQPRGSMQRISQRARRGKRPSSPSRERRQQRPSPHQPHTRPSGPGITSPGSTARTTWSSRDSGCQGGARCGWVWGRSGAGAVPFSIGEPDRSHAHSTAARDERLRAAYICHLLP